MLIAGQMGFQSLSLLCLSCILLLHTSGTTATFDAIYQFGDSLCDTGNAIRQNPAVCSSLPYGETFFNRPTGRCSDGLLIVDFLAKAFQLPLLNPYLDKDANFDNGVNFAVAGATALETSFFTAQNLSVFGNSSLSSQLGWFRTHLESICSSKEECKHRLRDALFLIGSVGGNDYNYYFGGGRTISDQYNLVPNVVNAIKNTIEEVIDHGAIHVVVPGFFPLGCSPVALANFASNDTSVFDEFMCIKSLNELFQFHNLKLQDAIKELQRLHPRVKISYGDTYAAYIWILRNAASLGFEKDGLFKTCCGDGNNAYNYNASRSCGTPGVMACENPKRRLSWDGLHLTHQAHMYLAGWLLANTFRGN